MKEKTVISIFIRVLLTLALSLFYLRFSNNGNNNYNLILISVDTLRADHIGVYRYPKNTTPNIDNWAKEAKVFTNAYTIIPSTPQSFYTLFHGRAVQYPMTDVTPLKTILKDTGTIIVDNDQSFKEAVKKGHLKSTLPTTLAVTLAT